MTTGLPLFSHLISLAAYHTARKMSSSYSKAMTRPGSRAHVDIDTSPHLYPHEQVGELRLRSSQVFVKNSSNIIVSYQPTTLDASALGTSGSYLDFRLLSGHVLKSATLHLTVRNSTEAAIRMPQTTNLHFACINRIEILGEGGSLQLQRLDGEYLNRMMNAVSPNALAHIIGSGSAATMPPGMTASQYLPLLGSIFEHTLCLPALNSPIVIRVYFNGAAGWVDGVAPTLVSAVLITDQDRLAAREHEDLVSRLRSGPPSDIRFNRPGFMRFTEQLAAGSRYVFPLTSVQGLVTSLHVSVKKTSEWGNGPTTSFATYDVLDGSGASIIGGTPVSNTYLKYIRAIGRDYELNDATDQWIPIAFTDNSLEHEQAGILSGYVCFDGVHQLALTTWAAFASGTYEIYVLVNRVACLRQAGGTLSIMES